MWMNASIYINVNTHIQNVLALGKLFPFDANQLVNDLLVDEAETVEADDLLQYGTVRGNR